jgi:hypothetical protein
LAKSLKNLCRYLSTALGCLAALGLGCGIAWAQAAPPAETPPTPPPVAGDSAPVLSSAAERVYAEARSRLLQIRTLVAAAGR